MYNAFPSWKSDLARILSLAKTPCWQPPRLCVNEQGCRRGAFLSPCRCEAEGSEHKQPPGAAPKWPVLSVPIGHCILSPAIQIDKGHKDGAGQYSRDFGTRNRTKQEMVLKAEWRKSAHYSCGECNPLKVGWLETPLLFQLPTWPFRGPNLTGFPRYPKKLLGSRKQHSAAWEKAVGDVGE